MTDIIILLLFGIGVGLYATERYKKSEGFRESTYIILGLTCAALICSGVVFLIEQLYNYEKHFR